MDALFLSCKLFVSGSIPSLSLTDDARRHPYPFRHGLAWWLLHKVSRRKNTARAKPKAASEEQIHLWKQHFKNLLGKPPKVTDKPFAKIISNQLDIKQGQFTQELNLILRKIKNSKGLDEIPPEVWKTRKFDDILLRSATLYITRTQMTDGPKDASSISSSQELLRYNPYFHGSQDLQCSTTQPPRT